MWQYMQTHTVKCLSIQLWCFKWILILPTLSNATYESKHHGLSTCFWQNELGCQQCFNTAGSSHWALETWPSKVRCVSGVKYTLALSYLIFSQKCTVPTWAAYLFLTEYRWLTTLSEFGVAAAQCHSVIHIYSIYLVFFRFFSTISYSKMS